MSIRVRILFLFAVSFFGAERSFAQGDLAWPEWQWTGLSGNVTAIYFFDAVHGVVVLNNSIYFTSNSHGRWSPANVPAGFSSPVNMIRNIQGKLYAATAADVIVSSDSGRTWKYSGLGLTNANDVYADATGKIRTLNPPLKVFARVDTLHCVAQGNGVIDVSSDGGVTWSPSLALQDPNSTGVFADRCHNVFLCPNSWGTAWRSTDFGQTWNTVVTGSGPGTEYLQGASVTAYIISDPGFYRSTDDGLTWRSVITVTDGGASHTPFFVFGPMGEHVAMPWLHSKTVTVNGRPHLSTATELWMTSTGGLDDLHSGPDLTDSNGAPLVQNDTFNIPLRITSRCNAMSIGLPFYSQVDSMYESVSILKDSLGDFAFTGPTSKLLRRGHEDTLYLAYNPHHMLSTVTLKIDNHWQCSDWSETRTVMVTSLPSAEMFAPPPLAGNCKIAREAAYLKLDSCQTMIVDSVQLPPRLATRLKFDHALPDTVLRGAGDSLFFTWDPRDTLTTIFDSVKIFAHYDGIDSALWWWDWRAYVGNNLPPYPPLSQFNRTLPITLYALPNVALITSDSAIAFRALKPCERLQDTIISVKNAGCTTDTVLTVNLRGDGFTMDPPPMPIIVRPDSSVTFHVHFLAPTDSSDRHGAIDLWVISGESKTVTIPLTGHGITNSALFAMRAALSADTISFCKTSITLFDTLRNQGCDTIFFDGPLAGSDTSFSATGLPAYIAPSDSAIVRVQFNTRIKGEHRDTLHFQYALGHSAMRDTTLFVQGYVRKGTSYLATSIGGADFPDLYACQSMDSTIYVINQGCDTLYIDSVSFRDASFSTLTRMPLIVRPNDSLPLVIHVSPDTTNHRYTIIGSMTLYSEASIVPTQSTPLSVRVAYPEVITLTLVGSAASARSDDDVSYALVVGGDLKTPRTIHFSISNNDDLLDSVSFTSSELHCDSTAHKGDGEIVRYFTLHVPASTDTVAILQYRVLLSEADSTNVGISDLGAEPVNGLAGACVTSLSANTLPFVYNAKCGDNMLTRYMASGLFTIDRITPNPAANQIHVGIIASDSLRSLVRIRAFDLLGREISLVSKSEFTYDVSGLPEGAYYLEAALGEERAVRRIIIQR